MEHFLFSTRSVSLLINEGTMFRLVPGKREQAETLYPHRHLFEAILSSIVSFRPPRHLFLHFIFLASFCNYCSVANKNITRLNSVAAIMCYVLLIYIVRQLGVITD